MQSADQRGFTLGEYGHLVEDRSEQIVGVLSPCEREVFASTLLQLRIKDMSVPFENIDEVLFDFREQVYPLLVSFVRPLRDCRLTLIYVVKRSARVGAVHKLTLECNDWNCSIGLQPASFAIRCPNSPRMYPGCQ